MLRRHAPLVRFFAILVGVYAVWFVLYDLWLLPDGRLDAWLSHRVATASAGLLGLIGFDVVHAGRVLGLDGAAGVEVADGCNGLTTVGLFIGFVLAFPGQWQRRMWFIPMGIGLLLLVNVLRVASLAIIQVEWPEAFASVHSFGATTFFYVVVFILWVVWANLGNSSSSPVTPSAALEGADQGVVA
ncbi:MAG: archaeosortase/exosortase family protein [Bacteroidota bacterium]